MNYYNILGVNNNADDIDIKKSFHKLALKYHPGVDISIYFLDE